MKICLFILSIFSTACFSGNVDLSIEINPSSFSNSSVDNTGEFSITITNSGPDDAGTESPFSISIDTERVYLDNGYFVEFTSNPNIQQDCLFFPTIIDPVPGDPPSVFFSFYTPAIPVGQSITCYGLFQTNFENGNRVVEWSLSSVTDDDIDLSNDVAVMSFFGFVAPVPSFSLWGSLLLTLSFLGIAFRYSIPENINNS